jgi:hypothetical protein
MDNIRAKLFYCQFYLEETCLAMISVPGMEFFSSTVVKIVPETPNGSFHEAFSLK